MGRRRHKEELCVEEHPIWSPTRLDLAETCMKSYWLKYVKKISPLISASTARGKLIHSMIEHFWKTDPKTGLIIPEPKFSYEGFVNMGVANWKRYYASDNPPGGKKPTDEIRWDYPGQKWDKHFTGELGDMLGRIYNRYMEEEPRLEAEIPLHAEVEGIKIMAIIDELRKYLIIRDHKSGYASMSPEYLRKNIQMTDYMLCLFIALQDSNHKLYRETYADYAGIGLEEFLDIAEIEIHHLPNNSRPYYSRKIHDFVYPEKEIKTQIHITKRNVKSIEEFVDSLKAKEKCLCERDFHPHQGRHCGFCFFKDNCDKYDPKKEHADELERNLPLFSFANLSFGNMQAKNPLIPPQPSQKGRQKIMRFRYLKEEDSQVKESLQKLEEARKSEQLDLTPASGISSN